MNLISIILFYLLSLTISRNEVSIEKKLFQDLLKKVNENFRKFFLKSLRYYIQIQLTKIFHRESIPKVEIILNQTLEICLKSDQIKRIFIEVDFSISILINFKF